jgi:transcriptional regulator with XRE-family HTH domain
VKKSIYSRENGEVVRLLKEIRQESELTQVQLAESLGITQSFLSKIERGERIVDIVQLREICHCLGTTLPKFVERLERRLRGT